MATKKRERIPEGDKEKVIKSLTYALYPHQHFRLVTNKHGGMITDVEYNPFSGPSPYSKMSLQLHQAWMDGNIQSFAVTFGGAAGVLAFLREAKQLIKLWIDKSGRRRIIVRAANKSLEIRGSSDIKGAIKAFKELESETGNGSSPTLEPNEGALTSMESTAVKDPKVAVRKKERRAAKPAKPKGKKEET